MHHATPIPGRDRYRLSSTARLKDANLQEDRQPELGGLQEF